jgi:hypothetical protein
MANDLNIFDSTDWEREMGPARGTRLGPTVGARDLGCALYGQGGGAHRVRNVSDAPARYLLVSTMRFPEVAEQLDTARSSR